MADRELYIHVGTHKTGSTAIQHILSRYNTHGVKYIYPNDEFSRICDESELDSLNVDKSTGMKSYLSKEVVRRHSKYVISEEEFSGNIFLCYKDAINIARRLKLATESIFPSVKIIIYIRDQKDWVQSIYTQEIHQGESYSFQDFLRVFDSTTIDWRHVIDSYVSVFGKDNVIIKRYDRMLLSERGGLIKDFFNSIGLDYSKLPLTKKSYNANSGYNRTALEFARRMNGGLSAIEKQFLRHELQRVASKKPFETYSFFSTGDCSDFLSLHKEANNSVMREYFSDDQVLFPSSGIDKDKEIDEISSQDMLLLLTKMHLSQNANRLYFVKFISIVESKLKIIFRKIPYLELKIKNVLFKYFG